MWLRPNLFQMLHVWNIYQPLSSTSPSHVGKYTMAGASKYLVGGLEHVLFFHILGLIIPIDFHIFQRDWNHQADIDFATWICRCCCYIRELISGARVSPHLGQVISWSFVGSWSMGASPHLPGSAWDVMISAGQLMLESSKLVFWRLGKNLGGDWRAT